MTYKSVIEAKRKPALNPAAKVLGNNASPEVKAEVDKMVGELLAKGRAKGIKNDEYSEEDILNIFKDEPDWSQQDISDVKNALDSAKKVDTEQNIHNSDQNNALSPEKQDALERMKKMMGNMTLKQIKLLKSQLVEGNSNENN